VAAFESAIGVEVATGEETVPVVQEQLPVLSKQSGHRLSGSSSLLLSGKAGSSSSEISMVSTDF